jgi:diguanylate cyclase (GGDEF)-like protein
MLSIYVFIPNRLVLTNTVALVGIAAATGVQILMGNSLGEVVFTFVFLCWPAMLGCVVAHRALMGSRRAYILLRASETANQSLETEIARRQALEAELQRQALTDPLTGLSNRRHYEMLFMREHDRCRRHNSALTLGMIDLDHFKRINDTHGHEFGDQVLQSAAEILQRPLCHIDILGRFGGEEFILILPDTGIVQAQAVAERMRESLEEEVVTVNGITATVTATIAITQVLATDTDIQECIRRADQALYQGKHAGRNRVVAADSA